MPTQKSIGRLSTSYSKRTAKKKDHKKSSNIVVRKPNGTTYIIPPVETEKLSREEKFLERWQDMLDAGIEIDEEDIPEDLYDVWQDFQEDIKPKIAKKNWLLWAAIFVPLILPSFVQGVTGKVNLPPDAIVPSVAMPAPKPERVADYAKKYFQDHGLELCKTLSKTDLKEVKQRMIDNWGKGEEFFKNSFQEDYASSKARLDTIYRTEFAIAQNEGIMARAKDAGHKFKVWNCALDERSCPICSSMHGQIAPIDEMWPGTDWMRPQDSHPNCRCVMTTLDEEDIDQEGIQEDASYLNDVSNFMKLNYKCKFDGNDFKCDNQLPADSTNEIPITNTFEMRQKVSDYININNIQKPYEEESQRLFEKWGSGPSSDWPEHLIKEYEQDYTNLNKLNKINHDAILAFNYNQADINNPKDEQDKILATQLKSTLDNIITKQPIVLWRGERKSDWDDMLKSGSGETDRFLALTQSKSIAEQFKTNNDLYLIRFELPIGSHAMPSWIETGVESPNELEWILNKKSKLEVTGKSGNILNVRIITDKQEQNSSFQEDASYLNDVSNFIKLNYKCPKGSHDEGFGCGGEGNLGPRTSSKISIMEPSESQLVLKGTRKPTKSEKLTVSKVVTTIPLELLKWANDLNIRKTGLEVVVTTPDYEASPNHGWTSHAMTNRVYLQQDVFKGNDKNRIYGEGTIKHELIHALVGNKIEACIPGGGKAILTRENIRMPIHAYDSNHDGGSIDEFYTMVMEYYEGNGKFNDEELSKIEVEKELGKGKWGDYLHSSKWTPEEISKVKNIVLHWTNDKNMLSAFLDKERKLQKWEEEDALLQKDDIRQDASYLHEVAELMKFNYNCPKEEKNGEGPGSCSNSKSTPTEKVSLTPETYEVMKKLHLEYSKQLTKEEKRAIKSEYTLNSTYINRYLSGNLKSDDEEFTNKVKNDAENAVSAINKFTTPFDILTWRGIKSNIEEKLPKGYLQVGTTFNNKTILSTSFKSPEKALGYSKWTYDENKKPLLAKIILPKGSNAMLTDSIIDPSAKYSFSSESEMLVAPSDIKVVNYTEDDNERIVTWEVLPKNIKTSASYLNDVADFMKLNYNCPESEKNGSKHPCSDVNSDDNKRANITKVKNVSEKVRSKMRKEKNVVSDTVNLALKVDHISSNPEVARAYNNIQLKYDEYHEIEKQYNKISVSNEYSNNQRIELANKLDKSKKDLNNLINYKQIMIKNIVLKDIINMTPKQRQDYRNIKQKELQSNTSNSDIVGMQFSTVERYIINSDNLDDESTEFKYVKINKIDDVEKYFGNNIKITNKDTSYGKHISINTLDQVAEERSLLLINYSMLRNVKMNIELSDKDDLGPYNAIWNPGINLLRIRYNISEEKEEYERGGERVWKRIGKENDYVTTGYDTRSVFRHELGHAVYDQLLSRKERNSIEDSCYWMDMVNSSNNKKRDNTKKYLSDYATVSPGELFAEMFCVMSNGYQVDKDVCPPAYNAILRILSKTEGI